MNGTVTITGVRWAESVRRKKNRGLVELNTYSKNHIVLLNDNEENRRLFETCSMKSRHIINPIVDWSCSEVWEFIKLRNIPYCILYDRGYKRLGCIGCPMSGSSNMKKELEMYPKFRDAYIRSFDRMILNRIESGLHPGWTDGLDVMNWLSNNKVFTLLLPLFRFFIESLKNLSAD